MRMLILNLRSDSLEAVNTALAGQGYDIVTEHGLSVEEVLALAPEVLVTEATPSDLSCCGMIAQLKSRPGTESPLKIVMIVQGGALERARALDLGADDVISFPFDASEFAARVRTQFREREPELELEAKLNDALKKEQLAETVEVLSSSRAKRRFGITQAIVVLAAAVILASAALLISNRHSRKDTLQLKAEIARLNGGLLQQDELLRRADQARAYFATKDALGSREGLKAQAAEIRKKMAADGDANSHSPKKQ